MNLRMNPICLYLSAALAVAVLAPAIAGPIADFEGALRAAYADYRNALFATNTNNREVSDRTIAAFDAKWSALTANYRLSPPPHYGEDEKWGESLKTVTDILVRAKVEAARGDLATAHETLETIRDALGELRARNGIVTYSDRIDAFHHAMERILTKPYAGFFGAGLIEFAEDVAVLAYLGNEMKKMPPPEVLLSPEFVPTLAAVLDVIMEMQSAARAGNVDRIRAVRTQIKPAFAKLFVKFG